MYYWYITCNIYTEEDIISYGMIDELIETRVVQKRYEFHICTKDENPEEAIKKRVWLMFSRVKRIEVLHKEPITSYKFCQLSAE